MEEYVKIPEQILECADTRPTKVSILEPETGLSLQRYASPKVLFFLARKGMLTKKLPISLMKRLGLYEDYKKQKAIVDLAKRKAGEYGYKLGNGERVVISPESVMAGAQVAYALGYDYYVPITAKEDGCTFSICCNDEKKKLLPENIKKFGKELVEKYKDETGASGVFLHPNGSLLIAGGNKNPDFKVEMSQEEVNNKITELFKEYGKGIEKENKDNKTKKEENNKNKTSKEKPEKNETSREELEEQIKNGVDKLNKNIDKDVRKEETINKAKELNNEVGKEVRNKNDITK